MRVLLDNSPKSRHRADSIEATLKHSVIYLPEKTKTLIINASYFLQTPEYKYMFLRWKKNNQHIKVCIFCDSQWHKLEFFLEEGEINPDSVLVGWNEVVLWLAHHEHS